jgi:mono/diheme cytochrome c family protein
MRFAMKLALVLVIALSITILYAAAPADAAKGKEIYKKTCISCHGEKGEVKPAIEKMFGKMSALDSKEVQSKTDDALITYILQPTGKMKPANISKTDAADVVAFLRTLAQPAQPAGTVKK